MRESRESLPIYIAVDSTKIVRCKWCGVAESEHWQHTQEGVFCSTDCSNAVAPNEYICFYLLAVTCFSAFFLSLSSNQSTSAPSFFSFPFIYNLSFIAILLSPLLLTARDARNYRKRVPKDSQRNKISSDMALLKTISSAVSCPRCSANIDIRKVGEDRVYNCEYCGASGTIELLRSQ